jgi:hypothetical protein
VLRGTQNTARETRAFLFPFPEAHDILIEQVAQRCPQRDGKKQKVGLTGNP